MRNGIVGLFLVLTLAACQTATNGQGPIVFSESVAAHFHHYMNQGHPSKFAVAESGRTSQYYYCPKNFFACQNTPDAEVIHKCEERSAGSKCFIFARERKVSWENPGNFLRNHAQGDVLLNGTEPVFLGQARTNFRTYKISGPGSEHRAFAVNYHLTQNMLFGYGWAANKATEALAGEAALDDCRKRSGGRSPQNCKLYMVNEDKVWFDAN